MEGGGDVIEEERSQQEENRVEEEEEEVSHHDHVGLKNKKLSWKKIDSFDLEAARFTSNQGPGSPHVIPYIQFVFN